MSTLCQEEVHTVGIKEWAKLKKQTNKNFLCLQSLYYSRKKKEERERDNEQWGPSSVNHTVCEGEEWGMRAGFWAQELGSRESLTETWGCGLRREWGLGVNPGSFARPAEEQQGQPQDKDLESSTKKQVPIPAGPHCSHCAALIRISWHAPNACFSCPHSTEHCNHKNTHSHQRRKCKPWIPIQQNKGPTSKTISFPCSGFFCLLFCLRQLK